MVLFLNQYKYLIIKNEATFLKKIWRFDWLQEVQFN